MANPTYKKIVDGEEQTLRVVMTAIRLLRKRQEKTKTRTLDAACDWLRF
jgi:hypothetical protein